LSQFLRVGNGWLKKSVANSIYVDLVVPAQVGVIPLFAHAKAVSPCCSRTGGDDPRRRKCSTIDLIDLWRERNPRKPICPWWSGKCITWNK